MTSASIFVSHKSGEYETKEIWTDKRRWVETWCNNHDVYVLQGEVYNAVVLESNGEGKGPVRTRRE